MRRDFGPLPAVIGYRDAAEPIAYINWRDRRGRCTVRQGHAARDEVLARTAPPAVVNDCLFHFAQINQPMGGSAPGSGAYHGEWGFRR